MNKFYYVPGDLVMWQPLGLNRPARPRLQAVIVLEEFYDYHGLGLIRGLRADNLKEVLFTSDELVPSNQLSG